MSQFLADYGLAPNESANTVQFSGWVNGLLPTPGVDGVPDQVTAPAQCATYLGGIAQTVRAMGYQQPLVRVADGSLNVMATLTGQLSASVEDLMDDTGKLSMTILYDNWITDWITNQTNIVQDLNMLVDPFPTQPDWRSRWGGKITEIHVKRDEKGVHSIELVALHFREHAKRLLVAANPIFPPEVQLPRMWVLPGPVRSICAITAFINLARLFSPVLSVITNIFNPAGWVNPLNPDAALNVAPTEWPLQVAFVDTALDQSRWSCLGATWTDWHTTFKDLLSDAGVVMKAYTYLTTDPDSPNTELVNLLTIVPDIIASITGIDFSQLDTGLTELAAPQRNCVVFSFENKSGVTGPTGTAADGLFDTVSVTLDDLITPVTIDLGTGTTYDPGQVLDGEPLVEASGISQTYLIEQLVDVAPGPPQVIWWDSTYNGVITTDIFYHKGSDLTIMTGSKSPTIVNEAQTFAIRYALSQLSDVINQGVADNLGVPLQIPGTPGLDNLYQGQLDNVLFAWERFTDPIRALYSGDVAWQEHFEKGTGTAYTLASILTLREGDWKTRAFISFKGSVKDGWPWVAYYDYQLGDRVGFEQNGVVYVDNVYGLKRTWDWTKPVETVLTIGEDKLKNDPFGAAFRTIATLYSFVGNLAGEGTIFEGGV